MNSTLDNNSKAFKTILNSTSISMIPGNIKDKLRTMEAIVAEMNNELIDRIDEIRDLTTDFSASYEVQKEIPKKLAIEIEQRVKTLNDQIDKHFAQQRLDNEKISHDLKDLGDGNDTIHMLILESENKLKDIEHSIGTEFMIELNETTKSTTRLRYGRTPGRNSVAVTRYRIRTKFSETEFLTQNS